MTEPSASVEDHVLGEGLCDGGVAACRVGLVEDVLQHAFHELGDSGHGAGTYRVVARPDRPRPEVALAPLLVTLATLAGRRWGAVVAGAVTALPIVAGPILAIIAIEHGREFGDAAARSALLGVVALAALVRGVRAHGRSQLAGDHRGGVAATYGVVAAALSGVDVPPAPAWRWASRRSSSRRLLLGPRPPVGPRSPPPSWDLPVRALLAAVLVLTLAGARRRPGTRGERRAGAVPHRDERHGGVRPRAGRPGRAAQPADGFVRALPGIALSFFVAAVAL